MAARPTRPPGHEPPLYDPRLEHDACGVGFVADAGGRRRAEVLGLGLAGLAALRHRGAVAADGASSDGAGVLLPLEADLLDHLGAAAGLRPGVVMAFLPAADDARRTARLVLERALADEGLLGVTWRDVPIAPAALGPDAAASLPAIAQALVERPPRLGDRRFEARLVLARRAAETAARRDGIELSIASASCRTVVYKGLVAGDRLADLYPDLRASLAVSSVVFHQRYATNTHPQWALAQPFRRLAHNGEINTIRANREQIRGRTADPVRGSVARRLLEVGPLVSADGSDSLSLDELVEVLELTGWPAESALLAVVPEALALRRAGHPLAAAFAARVAGVLGPWDGPAALVFSDGLRVGALADRNGLRPAAFAVTADRLVACASEAGAVPLVASETVRRGRLGPGELLLVDTRRGWVFEDTEAKTESLRHSWRAAPERTPFADHPGHGAAPTHAATPAPMRYLAGLDAERARLSIKTLALEAHEPLWSMGDDTPLAGMGRIDRPVADHLRQAFAQVTNPPIDPERERAVLDLSIEAGRKPPLLGGLPRPERRTSVRLERPLVADLDGLIAALDHAVQRPRARVRRLDATWPAAGGPAGLETALMRLGRQALAAARAGSVAIVVSDRAASLDRPPVPSVLAVGAIHAALTDAGLRGRTDILADAGDVLDVHGVAMVLAAGASVVHPRLAIELARELAGGRGAEDLTDDEVVERLLSGFEAGLRKTLARMGISTAASYVGGNLVESLELAPEVLARCLPAVIGWPGRLGFEALARRQLRRLERARALATAPPVGARAEVRLPDEGLARFRGDGERHLWAPVIVGAAQELVTDADPELVGQRLPVYRAALNGDAAVVRDHLVVRRPRGVAAVPLEEVELGGLDRPPIRRPRR